MCCRLVVLVTRNLEAAALYVTSVRNALATVVPGNERQKERMFSVPSAARREQGNNGREIHRLFSGRSHVVHCIVSYSRYDNLHLADPRYGGKLFSAAAYSGAHYLSKYRIKWLDAIVAFFIQARSWVYQTRPQDSRSTNTCKGLTAIIRYSEYIAKSWHASFGLLSTDLRKPTLASAPLAAHIARSTLWAEAAPQVDARINSPLSLPRKT